MFTVNQSTGRPQMFQFQAASSLPARATASAEDKSTTTPLTFNFNPLELSSVSPFPTAIPIRATELKDNKPISAPPVFKFKPLEPLSTVPVFTGLPMSPSAQPSKLADAAASHPNLDKHTALEIRTMPGAAFASPSTGSEDSGSEGESNGDSSTSSRSNGSLPEDTNHEGLAASIFSPLPTTAATHEKRSLTNTPQAQISTSKPDFVLHSQLLVKNGKGTKAALKRIESDIENTPLLSGTIVEAHSHDFVSQYGLLGCLDDQDPSLPASQIFLNIAAPFSTFICGVQGSGKSHTTSCILENALIPSRKLGQLKSPASTLVFNYGAWSNGGAGFNISEATYLATASKGNKGHSVKRITVLTSPSNPAINKLYQRHPNVRIIPFRLKACTLDIGVLAKLMAVDEKAAVPLYMARVQAILRDSATNSEKGSLDYKLFNKRLQRERFDPKQKNMLEMRLNLLESFLDLSNTAKEPDFLPGEITIMDLSDAFITPSTACVLFKIGLERFIESKALAKMVVLDEAHKYMHDNPGSIVLTDYLTEIIREQHHKGARVVISTQEPTVSPELIALCSITVIHRFTSPTWFAAIKKHINGIEDSQKTMNDIECLETGEALVYAPNAVLGKNKDITLIKATGRLLKLNIRNRVTLNDGVSIMAV